DSLLPGDVRISCINSESVSFRNGSGAEVVVLDLSDGYRSFLSLTIDILRRLADDSSGVNRGKSGMHQGLGSWMEEEDGEPRIVTEGIILIDEVDAHLHPSWQREIGFRLRRVFPRMQFIVTTHSPFVAQAASDGGLFVLRTAAPGKAVEVEQPIDSVKGWRVDQILTSPLFGLDATRDEETEALIRKHAELVARRTWRKLTRAEGQQLAQLTEKLDDRLTAPGETAEERELQAETAAFIRTALERRKAKK
ncbi:MAG: AAA family ATPase, partial [Isosphaeraceae bacterium]